MVRGLPGVDELRLSTPLLPSSATGVECEVATEPPPMIGRMGVCGWWTSERRGRDGGGEICMEARNK